jgi:hypothetical protein
LVFGRNSIFHENVREIRRQQLGANEFELSAHIPRKWIAESSQKRFPLVAPSWSKMSEFVSPRNLHEVSKTERFCCYQIIAQPSSAPFRWQRFLRMHLLTNEPSNMLALGAKSRFLSSYVQSPCTDQAIQSQLLAHFVSMKMLFAIFSYLITASSMQQRSLAYSITGPTHRGV